MTASWLDGKGTAIDEQRFTLRELAPQPISKLDDDAQTRMRIMVMAGVENEQNRFLHAFSRADPNLAGPLAMIRRVEHQQQALLMNLLPPDLSPVEAAIGYTQAAVELTSLLAQAEPDPYLASVYRFSLSEDVDHLYRWAALLDRLDGRDANTILQGYTTIRSGRPTPSTHRAPDDDLRTPYDRLSTQIASKINLLTLIGIKTQLRDQLMSLGPQCADPVARQLFAEIGLVEEQHLTQYGSLIDSGETWLEKWLLHEATEVFLYRSWVAQESSPRIKDIWTRFGSYESGQLVAVGKLIATNERRDPDTILSLEMPPTLDWSLQRRHIDGVVDAELGLRASGTRIVPTEEDSPSSLRYRAYLGKDGSPSLDVIGQQFVWSPGGELSRNRVPQLDVSMPSKEKDHGETSRS